MAASSSGKAGAGLHKLLPFFVGITKHKPLKGAETQTTHYVAIEQKVASRLGTKSKGTAKTNGGADVLENNIVYQTNRKGKKGNHTAKRVVGRCGKPITAYLNTTVKQKNGKEVPESYTIGFPSGVPLGLIIKFFRDNCPNVVRIGTGGNMYQVR